MIDSILSFVAPHLCSGCGKTGSLLCDNCKYNIVSELKTACLGCQKPCGDKGVCNTCRVPYSRAWQVGERRDVLQRLVGLYKFERAKTAYKELGDLLMEVLPVFPAECIIVPVPTVRSHVRERGYDHTLLLARYIARKRGLKVSTVLMRISNTTQRHTSAAERIKQAKLAFAVRGEIVRDAPYLLLDDILTTGATINYAAKALKDAGASEVWAAVIARQTLD